MRNYSKNVPVLKILDICICCNFELSLYYWKQNLRCLRTSNGNIRLRVCPRVTETDGQQQSLVSAAADDATNAPKLDTVIVLRLRRT